MFNVRIISWNSGCLCVLYIGYILVSGKTKQEHDKNLDFVFTVLWDAGLKLKSEKCLLAQDRVTYTGVILLITKDCILYSPITSEKIRIMTRRDPVLSKILDYGTTGSWHTNCVDINLSAYFNKQDDISIEQGCVLWDTHVIIPSRGRERVL